MQIELKNVSYTDRTPCGMGNIVNMSLTVNDGDFIGVMGSGNGGGKALAALISGAVRPCSGSISIDGKEVEQYGHGGRVGHLMADSWKLFTQPTIEKEIAPAVMRLNFGKPESAEAVKRAMELVGFDYDSDRNNRIQALSEDEKILVSLAKILAVYPDILVLDDILSTMKAPDRVRIMELLKKLNGSGMPVILLSNDSDILSEYANRILIMQDGIAVRDGSARHILSEYYDLLHLNVDPSAVRYCVQKLREHGFDMPDNVFSYEQFIDRLKILLWRITG